MTRRPLRGFSPSAFIAIRRHRDIAVSELSRLTGVSQAAIHNWESGHSTPQADLLARTMTVLNTPIEHVIDIPPDQRFPSDWRVINGITQLQLAAAADIAPTTLRGIERADINLTDANAAKLAGHLGISEADYRAAYQRARQRPAGTSA